FETVERLITDNETERFAAVTWASLSLEREQHPEYEQFVNDLLDVAVVEHMNIVKPLYELEQRRFSHYAWHIGEVFICMMALNSDLYDVINHVFGSIIRKELAIEVTEKEKREVRRISVGISAREKETASKKLYDDIVDYIHARGEFKSDSLAQKNPNEFIQVLADRMRGSRRYVIQDVMNRQALLKKQQAEKALSERLAGAEDIILARDPFKKAVNLYWTEKRYNFKYVAVEKVRVTVQVLAILTGIVYFLMGYLNLYGMHWLEGIIVALGMYIFARVAASRRAFSRFFPEDVSKELEIVVGSFTPTLRKMSKEQMDAFLVAQVRDPANHKLLHIVPEFIKYIFAIMPDRSNMIVSMEELGDVMENLELDLARTMREVSQGPRNPLA
ncbi:MAG: hypothetical protein IIA14_09215, partial [SAR324 cluster bacterium]|nr:hypothetical protein [SAR324 cluster bacterium]